MITEYALIGAGVIVILYLLFKLLKKSIKWGAIILIGLIVFSSLTSFSLIKEAKDIKNNFNSGNKIVLLDVDGKISGGIEGKLIGGDINRLSEEEISRVNDHISKGDYKDALGDDFMLLKLDSSLFKGREVVMDNLSISADDLLAIYDKDDKADAFVRLFLEKKGYEISDSTVEITKKELFKDMNKNNAGSYIFSLILSSTNNDSLFFIEGIKKGGVYIYPEKSIFKAIKYIPISVVKRWGFSAS